MRKILLLSADRAEKGLIEPVMTELAEYKPDVEAQWCIFEQKRPDEVITQFGSMLFEFSPDIVLVPTDRYEMVYAAAYAFHNNRIVAHFHAGNVDGYPDEMNRRAISCFSHIMFCNTARDKENLVRMGEEDWRIYVVGSTAFDHIDIDTSLCPALPYDLVVLHPDPTSKKQTLADMEAVLINLKKEASPCIIWLGPNKDLNHEVILDILKEYSFSMSPEQIKQYGYKIILQNLPREQYLGLLKQCRRAIGNSSSFVYELSYLNPEAQVIQIGFRNKDRERPEAIVPGGSRKIASILAQIDLNSVRRKRFILLNH